MAATDQRGKRSRLDVEMEELIPPPPVMTVQEVKEQVDLALHNVDVLLDNLRTEKDTKRIELLRKTVTAVQSAISKLSTGFLSEIAVNRTSKFLLSSLECKCRSTGGSHSVQSTSSRSAVTQARSFAAACASPAAAINPATRVIPAKGKAFMIKNSDRIVIGPKDEARNRYSDSQATKMEIQKCINPAEMKLKIQRFAFSKNSSVVIEGDSLDAESFKTCSALRDAGLEVKQDVLMKPRIIVYDLPVDLEGSEVIKCLFKQNVPDVATEDIKQIYMYPKAGKKFRSGVFETSPSVRLQLLNRGKVNIMWSRCRIDDHVTVMQCHECSDFNHFAATCTAPAFVCGICAESHATKDCKNKSKPRCVNCVKAGSSNTAHAANDSSKCPIVRRKMDRKISLID